LFFSLWTICTYVLLCTYWLCYFIIIIVLCTVFTALLFSYSAIFIAASVRNKLIHSRLLPVACRTQRVHFIVPLMPCYRQSSNVELEIVIIELLKTKCLPILYHVLEGWTIDKSQQNSLSYVGLLNTSLRKIFRTKSTDVVKDCMLMFNRQKAKDAIFNGKRKLLTNYASLNNLVCNVFQNCANVK